MKILLISANRERHPWPIPPIGACYIASNLESSGFDVQLLDVLFAENPSSAITEKIHQFMPDLVGVSIRNIDNVDQQSSCFYLTGVKEEVIDPVKRVTSAPLVIGGTAVSIMPERIMDFLGVDYAVCGEGEETLVQFARYMEQNNDISSICGLLYRKNGRITGNRVERIEDLDGLALPRVYRWVDWRRYRLNYAPYPVQTKRGCALSCTYCVYNRIEGHHYRLRDPEGIVDEIEDIVENCKPSVIEFTDSTFNIPLEHALEICREIIRRKIKVSINTMGINPGSVTEELAALMKEANFIEVSCTPESGSERMLKTLGKNFTVKHIERASRLLSNAGIPVVWYFLFGGPGEDESTVRETFSFIEENIVNRDLVFITSGIRVLPGSPICTLARETGQLPDTTDLLLPVWFQPERISMETMLYLINREVITHSNYINLQDNTDESMLARALKSVYSILGLKEPVWANVIRRDFFYKLTCYNRYRLWKLEKEHREYSK
ncbi:MAG: cobalamin-dependent protein [Candidatus Fermentibacteraceae bacterium]|nr:cobalamin-dependent protein [Candidatus Fermentibacteraceae bacterium]